MILRLFMLFGVGYGAAAFAGHEDTVVVGQIKALKRTFVVEAEILSTLCLENIHHAPFSGNMGHTSTCWALVTNQELALPPAPLGYQDDVVTRKFVETIGDEQAKITLSISVGSRGFHVMAISSDVKFSPQLTAIVEQKIKDTFTELNGQKIATRKIYFEE